LFEVQEGLPEDEKNALFEKNRIIDEENSRKIIPPGLSFRINEFVNISEIFESVSLGLDKIGKNASFTVWDSNIDSDNTFTVDIGLGMRANYIILNAINFKSERMVKINKYLEYIEELY
jgi:enolase